MRRLSTRVLAGALFLLASLVVSAAPAWAMVDAGGAGGGPASPANSGGMNGALVAGIAIAVVAAAAAIVLLVLRRRRRRPAAALPVTMPERIPSGPAQSTEAEQPRRAPRAA